MSDPVERATGGVWRIEALEPDAEGGFVARLVTEDGPLVLDAHPAEPDARAYRVHRGLAFSYRGRREQAAPAWIAHLDAAIDALADASVMRTTAPIEARARAAPSTGASSTGAPSTEAASTEAPSTEAPPPESARRFPTPRERLALDSAPPLPSSVIDAYRRDGHVLVRRLLPPAVLRAARPSVERAIARATPVDRPTPTSAYARAFLQLDNLGLDDEAVAALSQCRRIAAALAQLMGGAGVRIFCEDWLIKEPGAAITPWHQDSAVFPFDAAASCTAWIPLAAVRPEMGLPRFARASHELGVVEAVENIDDTSEQVFAQLIAERGFVVDSLAPTLLGDVSFHDGRTIHGASPNVSDETRVVLALHCYADGARVREPRTPTMGQTLALYGPGLAPGAPAASRAWVRTLPRIEAGAPEVLFGAHAIALDDGAAYRFEHRADGRVTREPIERAAATDGFACGGLVDCHAHISWPHDDREAQPESASFMNERRASYAAAGVTLLRDMGSSADAISALADVPGLPHVEAAGRLLVRDDTFPFTDTAPERLREEAEARVLRGASWVKVFTDWTDDWGGRDRTGFASDAPVTYALPVLRAAVERVHELGARVAAHCFTREGAEVAIEAGVDTLEHGWGIDEALLERMSQRGTAWVPLTAIAPGMRRAGERDGDRARVAWVDASIERLAATIPRAHAMGVAVLAGTDWFPEVSVLDEARALGALGLPADAALGAITHEARRYLGAPPLGDGVDLVVFEDDPRLDLEALAHAHVVVIGGVRVR